jgi:hypothetical protein
MSANANVAHHMRFDAIFNLRPLAAQRGVHLQPHDRVSRNDELIEGLGRRFRGTRDVLRVVVGVNDGWCLGVGWRCWR